MPSFKRKSIQQLRADNKRMRVPRLPMAVRSNTPALNSRFQSISKREIKNIDLSFGSKSTYCDVSSSLTLINAITAGTGNGQMIGNIATIKSVSFNYVLGNIPIANASELQLVPSPVRAMLIYDKTPTNTVANVTQILTTQTLTSLRNVDYTDRFIVLYDKLHTDIGFTTTVTGGVTYNIGGGKMNEAVKNFIPCSLKFNGPSTAGIVGITEGALYFLFISDNLTTTSPTYYKGDCRVRYTDA